MLERHIAPAVEARQARRLILPWRSKPNRLASTAIAAATLLALGLTISRESAFQARGDLVSDQTAEVASPANPSGLVVEIRRTLKGLHDRMINVGNQLTENTYVSDVIEGQLAVGPVKIESAKANLQSAQLAREAAENAVVEFQKGIVQEEAGAEEEAKLARRELERLRRRIPHFERASSPDRAGVKSKGRGLSGRSAYCRRAGRNESRTYYGTSRGETQGSRRMDQAQNDQGTRIRGRRSHVR